MKNLFIIALFASLIFSAQGLNAQKLINRSNEFAASGGFWFLNHAIGPKHIGISPKLGALLAPSALSITENPAGLAFIRNNEIILSFDILAFRARGGSIFAAIRLPSGFNLGFGGGVYTLWDKDLPDYFEFTNFTAISNIALSYIDTDSDSIPIYHAKKINTSFAFGLKYISEIFYGNIRHAILGDAGLSIPFFSIIHLGLSFKNFGIKTKSRSTIEINWPEISAAISYQSTSPGIAVGISISKDLSMIEKSIVIDIGGSFSLLTIFEKNPQPENTETEQRKITFGWSALAGIQVYPAFKVNIGSEWKLKGFTIATGASFPMTNFNFNAHDPFRYTQRIEWSSSIGAQF